MTTRKGKVLGSRLYRSAGVKKELVEGFRQSGESMASYCRRNNLALSSFCSWNRKMSCAGSEKVSSSEELPVRFIELGAGISPSTVGRGKDYNKSPEPTHMVKLQLGRVITLELSWKEQ